MSNEVSNCYSILFFLKYESWVNSQLVKETIVHKFPELINEVFEFEMWNCRYPSGALIPSGLYVIRVDYGLLYLKNGHMEYFEIKKALTNDLTVIN